MGGVRGVPNEENGVLLVLFVMFDIFLEGWKIDAKHSKIICSEK